MAGMTDQEWETLRTGFDTHRLLDAVDELDTLRGTLSDDGHRPPPIRNRLLKLHGMAMEVVNNGAQHRARALFDLAQEVEDEVFDMLEAVTKLHETLSTLTGLQPESLNDDGGDES